MDVSNTLIVVDAHFLNNIGKLDQYLTEASIAYSYEIGHRMELKPAIKWH